MKTTSIILTVTTSIETRLPTDLLQYIVSFSDLYHLQFVNKSFNKFVCNQIQQNVNEQQLQYETLCSSVSSKQQGTNQRTWIVAASNNNKLQETVDLATAGDTIMMRGGDYGTNIDMINGDSLWIDKNLKIIGFSSDVNFSYNQIYIDACVYFQNIQFKLEECASINLENQSLLSVSKCKFDFQTYAVHIKPESHVTIGNSKFKGGNDSHFVLVFGISDGYDSPTYVRILDCLFTNCGGSAYCYSAISSNSSNQNINMDRFSGNRFIRNSGYPISDIVPATLTLEKMFKNNVFDVATIRSMLRTMFM